MWEDFTLKITLLLIIVLSDLKKYTEDHWLLCSQYCEGEWSLLIFFQFSKDRKINGIFFAMVYWTVMIIVHLICMFLICPLSLFFSHISNQWSIVISVTLFLNQPENDINFTLQFWSTLALEKSQFQLHLGRKNQTAQQLQGSADRGGLDINKVLSFQIHVNCVNALLYSVSVRNCPSPGHGVLYIMIGDLISNVCGYLPPIKCKQISLTLIILTV